MILPRRFEIVVASAPPAQHTGRVWGLITAGDVQAEQARTLASAQATDLAVQACTSMDATTKATWGLFFADLTRWCKTPIVNFWTPWMPANAVVVTGDTGDTMMAYEGGLATWQGNLAKTCPQSPTAIVPAGNPPVAAPPVNFPPSLAPFNPAGNAPPGPPSWLCTTLGVGCDQGSWADAAKWIAILGVVGLTAWYAGPLIVTMVGATAGAIRKRVG